MLPSTKSLVAFAAVARFGGVRAAAAELGLTQSTVSHQISTLEKTLRLSLFERRGRNLALSEVGQNYLQHVEPVLDRLDRATRQIARFDPAQQFTILAPPTFMATWLLPNAAEIEALFPGTSLRLLESLTLAKDVRDVDIAVEYRFQPNPEADSRFLMSDELSAFASPQYAQDNGLHSFDDLDRARLIETERRLSSWVDLLGAERPGAPRKFLTVTYSYLAFEAARLGLGVALGNRINAAPYLTAGTLIEPFELPERLFPQLPNYYVTIPRQLVRRKRATKMRDWLFAKMLEHIPFKWVHLNDKNMLQQIESGAISYHSDDSV